MCLLPLVSTQLDLLCCGRPTLLVMFGFFTIILVRALLVIFEFDNITLVPIPRVNGSKRHRQNRSGKMLRLPGI